MAKKKYYVVWKGVTPGIYSSWEECQVQIAGVQALYKSFSSLEEAERAYASPAHEYIGRDTKSSTPSNTAQQSIIKNALAVDAACSGNPGMMEYRGVYIATGEEIFHFGPMYGTNNIGEFLAIVLGLAYLKKHNLPWVLYSDSRTAISWIRQKKCKTKLEWSQKNMDLLLAVRAAEKWLSENTWTTTICKWDTENWGEIPADFGRK